MATIMAGVGGLCYQPSCLHTARNFHPFCFPKGREGTATSVALPKPGSFLNSTSLELANKKLRAGVVRLPSPPMATHSSGSAAGYLPAISELYRSLIEKLDAGLLLESLGPTSLVFIFKEGIIVAMEHHHKFSDDYVPNVFELNSHMLAALSGGSDKDLGSEFLLKDLQEKCRLHERATGRRTSVVEASKWLADAISSSSKVDPFLGVLIAGWEETGAVLYHVDGWGRVCDCKKIENSLGMVHKCAIISIGSAAYDARRPMLGSLYYDMPLAEAEFYAKDSICYAKWRKERKNNRTRKEKNNRTRKAATNKDCDVISVYHIGSNGWKKCMSAHDIQDHQKKHLPKSEEERRGGKKGMADQFVAVEDDSVVYKPIKRT